MNESVHTEEKNGVRLRIEYDPQPSNPRDCDNLGRMVCFHPRYNLGDEVHYDLPKGVRYHFDADNEPVEDEVDYGWGVSGKGTFKEPAQVIAFLKVIEAEGGAVLPLYLYEHSGITIRTGPFDCPWDSGQVGFIYMTAQTIEETWALEKAKAALKAEVEEYDLLLTGQVYGYVIEELEGDLENDVWEHVDSCWGFFGLEYAKEEGESALKAAIEERKARLLKEEQEEIEAEEDAEQE
jgi:hypothetical protein